MKKVFTVVFFLLILSVVSFAKQIAIIGAMESEIASLKSAMNMSNQITIAGITYYEGMLDGKNVVVFKSGVGKVNAAIATTTLLNKFDISSIIFTGIAGGIEPKSKVGDIVISKDLVQHDYNPNSDKPGMVPGSKNGKFIADAKLVSLAQKSAVSVMGKDRVFTGTIATGDEFIKSKDKVDWIKKTFNASAVEMEGAAVAQVATLFNIPFVVIRSMSDKADEEAPMTYEKFQTMAAENSVKIVRAMLPKMK